jgi:hypothetical protein
MLYASRESGGKCATICALRHTSAVPKREFVGKYLLIYAHIVLGIAFYTLAFLPEKKE